MLVGHFLNKKIRRVQPTVSSASLWQVVWGFEKGSSADRRNSVFMASSVPPSNSDKFLLWLPVKVDSNLGAEVRPLLLQVAFAYSVYHTTESELGQCP